MFVEVRRSVRCGHAHPPCVCGWALVVPQAAATPTLHSPAYTYTFGAAKGSATAVGGSDDDYGLLPQKAPPSGDGPLGRGVALGATAAGGGAASSFHPDALTRAVLAKQQQQRHGLRDNPLCSLNASLDLQAASSSPPPALLLPVPLRGVAVTSDRIGTTVFTPPPMPAGDPDSPRASQQPQQLAAPASNGRVPSGGYHPAATAGYSAPEAAVDSSAATNPFETPALRSQDNDVPQPVGGRGGNGDGGGSQAGGGIGAAPQAAATAAAAHKQELLQQVGRCRALLRCRSSPKCMTL